jgi:transcriptional regulator with XRE-family HTH domain
MAKHLRERAYYIRAMEFCRSRREELGWKQLTVANHLGVSQDTYWRWEAGNASLTDGQLKKLLAILEATQEDLDIYIRATDVAADALPPAPTDPTCRPDRPICGSSDSFS